jgi:hypothetical protein
MPIHGYPGGVITANPVAPTSTVATGVWTTEQQLQAKSAGNWPFAAQQISRSLRFNSPDVTYLNRTPASATNQKTWTWSAWVKRSVLGATKVLFDARGAGSNPVHAFYFNSSDQLAVFIRNASATVIGNYNTSAVFRDLSAWYYITYKFDSTQATATNRVQIYVNGVLQSITASTTISQNADAFINSAISHGIGAEGVTPTDEFDGYMTEINFIDGQALTPSSFGRTNTDTGVWEPIAYSGTYGTNGFYLNFSDNSNTTATTLGKDYSGNGNNWTPNGFSVTPGNGDDSLVDTPSPYGTDTGIGGEVRGNYCTLNPLVTSNSVPVYIKGNLLVSGGGAGVWSESHGTISITSDKWYWEIKPYDQFVFVGVNSNTYVTGQTDPHTRTGSLTWYGSTGLIWSNGSATATNIGTFNGTNTIGVALDKSANTIQFYKDGVAAGSAQSLSTPIGSNAAIPCLFINAATSVFYTSNFGQRAFANTAPSGFKAVCVQNLPTPTIGATSTTQANDYFDATLYAGNNTAGRNVTNSGSFQPYFVWIKNRSGANGHILTDAVRGVTKTLVSDSTTQELTVAGGLTAFNSNGFQVGYDGTAIVNATGSNYVGWQWRANGAGSTNTAGIITSTVSVNTTSGFSIVTYTGNGLGGSTIGHGLGVAPSMIIVKRRDAGSSGWSVYFTTLAAGYILALQSTGAQANSPARFTTTLPTATVFSIGTDSDLNASAGTYVAYCFAPVAGYSAFGSYTGNGSADGPFIYTGFRPRYVMVKRTDAANDWLIIDTSRNPNNVTNLNLWANLSNAEGTADRTDILSNGFKLRNNFAEHNASGGTYIYACFAEFPFKYSLAR